MELLSLFITSVMPVIKVLVVLAIGLFLATESVDLLGPNARHHLNNLVFYVFLPALIGCSIAKTSTVKTLETLWFMPVNIFISCIIGSVLGCILVKITKAPPCLKGLVIACSSAANLGNMLNIILPALCEETNSPFGDSSTCSTYGESYASLSLAVSSVLLLLHECVNEEMYNKTCFIVKETAEILSETLAEPLLVSHGISEDNIYHVDLPDEGNQRALVVDSAPFHVIYSSIEFIGEAGIPSMTLIVGANLLKGLKGSGVKTSLIVGILIIRNILLPASGIVVVKAAMHLGLVGSYSLYQFTLLLQYAIPPAMNIGTILQMLGTGESEFSVLMLWSYVVAAFSLTLWTAFYIWLVT
ncbi:hypothetical protein Gohar_019376 [Gossypium harknessii]|uniref:Protein PIN-LIKES 3-like n=1 Tax=Gossypium harknessii TaxID=34285 RepID=A0A7J9IB64_9ROSI|nr:hypothetical protein [Gossypium harknessii]